MKLASSLKRMGLQDKEDCASVTLGTVRYFHEQSISPTGRNLLREKFGIQAKASNLDTGILHSYVLPKSRGGGFSRGCRRVLFSSTPKENSKMVCARYVIGIIDLV